MIDADVRTQDCVSRQNFMSVPHCCLSREPSCGLVRKCSVVHSAVMKGSKLRLIAPASGPLKSRWRASTTVVPGRKQVAAVCYRVRDGNIDFLLVRTRKGRWIFPKGGVEAGLTYAESAALEAMEEAGAHGRIEEAPFTSYTLKKSRGENLSPVKAYLCAVVRIEPAQEFYRNPTWFSDLKAKQRLQESRSAEDATEFARVIDAAISRIRRLQNGSAPTRDALQRVQFESPAVSGDIEAASLIHSLKADRAEATLRLPTKANCAKLLELGKGSFQR